MDIAYVLILIIVAALFYWLYQRAVYDFSRGYKEGLEEGNRLSKQMKNPPTETD